jgi:hypothetical protein
MPDPGILNNFGWGAVGLAALWMVLTKKPWKSDKSNHQSNGNAGSVSPAQWREWIGEIVEEKLKPIKSQLDRLENK